MSSTSPYVCRTCGGAASLRTAAGAPRVFCANRACGAVHKFESGPSAPSVQAASAPACGKCGGGGLVSAVGPGGRNAGRRYHACGRCNEFIDWIDSAPVGSGSSSSSSSSSSGGDATVLCTCGQAAKLRTSGPSSKNPGRQYYACAKPRDQECRFFQWSDAPAAAAATASASASSSSSSPAASAAASGVVLCTCGQAAKLCTSGPQSKNPGRQFYGCAKPRDQDCRFFQWADVPAAAGAGAVAVAAQPQARPPARTAGSALVCACGQPPASAVVNNTVVYRCSARACAFVQYNDGLHSKEPPWQQKMRRMCAEALRRRAEREGAGADLDAPFTATDVMALVALSDAEIDLIATYPQGGVDWLLAHWLRITGSNIGAIIGLNPHKSPAQALRDIVFGQEPFQNAAMEFGIKMESYTRLQYIALRGGQLYESLAQHYGIDPDDLIHTRMTGSKRARPASFRSMLQRLDGEPAAAAGAGAGAGGQQQQRATAALECAPGSAAAFRDPNFRVQLANFTINPKMRHLGASPDGVVLYTNPATGIEKRGVLEIKTRRGAALPIDYSDQTHTTHAMQQRHAAAIPDGVPAHYFAQCVLNMAIQRATFADFVVCNTGTLRVTTIEWTEAVRDFWNDMYRDATHFYTQAVIPCAVDALNGAVAADAPLDSYVTRAARGADAVTVADARARS